MVSVLATEMALDLAVASEARPVIVKENNQRLIGNAVAPNNLAKKSISQI